MSVTCCSSTRLKVCTMSGKSTMEEMEEYDRVINQTFRSEEEFYDFYNFFAASKGFSIRKNLVRRDEFTNEVIWRRYTCSNEGFREAKHFGKPVKKREPSGLTQCDCPAKLEVQRCSKSGTWYVTNFVDQHSHEGLNHSWRRIMEDPMTQDFYYMTCIIFLQG